MLAQRLKRYAFGGVLACLLWIGGCAALGFGVVLWLWPVLWLLSLNAQALALEQVIASFVHGDDPTPRPTWGQRRQAWWAELRHSTRTFGWDMPFASHAWPDRLSVVGVPSGRGVLLVHGFLCNRGFWNRWFEPLQAQGAPCVAVSLEPVFGSIDDYADQIEAAITRLHDATGQAPLVVCHSMGGLALRAWRRSRLAHGERMEAVDVRVHHVLTVASPHRGLWLASYGQHPSAWQMRRDSPWLQALAASESAAWRARFTCVFSECDNVVFPPRCATLDEAAEQHLTGRGHQELLDDPAVFRLAMALRV